LAHKWVLLLIIVGMMLFIVGRRFQVMLDLWRRWQGTLAALPKMEQDAKRGVWTFIKLAALVLLIVWAAAIRLNT